MINTRAWVNTSKIIAYVGYSVDIESLLLIRQYLLTQPLMACLYSDYNYLNNRHDVRSEFLFSSINDNLDVTNVYFVVGTDLRMEAPLLATYIMGQSYVKVINAINFRLLPVDCFNIGYDITDMIYGTRHECYLLTHSKNINLIHGMKLINYAHSLFKILDNNLIISNMIDIEHKTYLTKNSILAYANHAIIYEIACDSINDHFNLCTINDNSSNQHIFIEADED